MLTREQLEGMPTTELIKLYNSLLKAKLKRFSDRQTALARTWAAVQQKQSEAAVATPPPPAAQRGVRTIRNGAKSGRPRSDFSVELKGEGKSTVRAASLRGKILAHLRTLSPSEATVEALEKVFGAKTRGAVQKLLEKEWLSRKAIAA